MKKIKNYFKNWESYRHGFYFFNNSTIFCHSDEKCIPSKYIALEDAFIEKSHCGYKYFIRVKAKPVKYQAS